MLRKSLHRLILGIVAAAVLCCQTTGVVALPKDASFPKSYDQDERAFLTKFIAQHVADEAENISSAVKCHYWIDESEQSNLKKT